MTSTIFDGFYSDPGPLEGIKIRRVPVLFGGHNLSPLVEIGLTDLPKSGGAMAPPAPPGTTSLIYKKLMADTYNYLIRYKTFMKLFYTLQSEQGFTYFSKQ